MFTAESLDGGRLTFGASICMADRVSPDKLRQLLRYDPETGALYWRARPDDMFGTVAKSRRWNTRYADKRAFTALDKDGYLIGTVLGSGHRAQRVAWAIAFGARPSAEVDHIDRDRVNNRLSNLREASRRENNLNTRSRSGTTSQYRGVKRRASAAKWIAQIQIDGRKEHLGTFADEAEAARAYDAAARLRHGAYANLNFAEVG
jgi:hypothetical protein